MDFRMQFREPRRRILDKWKKNFLDSGKIKKTQISQKKIPRNYSYGRGEYSLDNPDKSFSINGRKCSLDVRKWLRKVQILFSPKCSYGNVEASFNTQPNCFWQMTKEVLLNVHKKIRKTQFVQKNYRQKVPMDT